MSAEVIVLCEVAEAFCICNRAADHEGAHECACGGSWTFNTDGEFVIVELPQRVVYW